VPYMAVGERATEESVQQAVDQLAAKFYALAGERNDFVQQMNLFLAVLRQDNQLLEALTRRAEYEKWAAAIPAIAGAARFGWDFSISPGIVPASPASDDIVVLTRKELTDAVARQGVACRREEQRVAPASLLWSFATSGQNEELYGPDWAKLSILEASPRAQFGAPEISVVLPSNGVTAEDWMENFTLSGNNSAANVPVFVRNVFLPRRVFRTMAFKSDQIETLSPYRISPDSVVVFDNGQAYFQGPDFALTDSVQVEPQQRLAGKTVTVGFTEYFPAYQCSVDGKTWGKPVMLDPNRTAPDDTADNPVTIVDGLKFPITDEIGNPTGMTLEVKNTVTREFTVLVQSSRPVNDTFAFGVPATLEIEFDRPMFLNGVHLDPFVNFPALLRGIYCEGILGNDPAYVWQGNYNLDRGQDIMFATREVIKMRLDFFQPNYSIKNHLVNTKNRDRVDAMTAIQAALPYQVRNLNRRLTEERSGCQYEFGLREVAGISSAPEMSVILGKQPVFYNGPYKAAGQPDVFRVDTDVIGAVLTSVVTREYAADQTAQADVETEIVSGETFVYDPVTESPAAVEFFVKFQLLSPDAVVQRFSLQVK
jgi:hypothetical protein